MNSLNLRIVGEKKKEPLKRDIKENLSFLSSYNAIEDVKSIFDAKTVGDQISSLKNVMGELNKKEDINPKIVDFYIELFFKVDFKSPLKLPVFRLLMLSKFKLLVEAKFSLFLHNKMKDSQDPNTINDCVSTINFCLENSEIFPVKVLYDSLSYMEQSLQICLRCLRETTVPTEILTIINSIHSCTRCTINILQITDLKTNEVLFDLIISLLKNEYLPLDTKSNAGILSVLICKMLYGKFDWFDLIKKTSEDDLIKICIISGMFNVLDEEDLNAGIIYKDGGTNILNFAVNTIVEIEERNSAVCNLVLASSRSLLLATRSVLLYPDFCTDKLVRKFLSYILVHLEHNMDAVSHLASSMLSNLVKIQKKIGGEHISEAILKDLANIPSERRSNNAALSALITFVPVAKIISNNPSLIQNLLQSSLKNSISVNHATNSFVSLMKQDYKERKKDWNETWVLPVLNAISSDPNVAIEHILSTAIKVDSGVFDYSLQILDCPFLEKKFLKILLILRIGQKTGLLSGKKNSNELWKGVLSYKEIETCIKRSDEERVSCFALLTETLKSTEIFEIEDFSLIKIFLYYDINCQSLTVRQKSFGIFKKFITRFVDSLASYSKMKEKDQKIILAYEKFRNWIIEFLIENVFPGANFLRKGAALHLLGLCDQKGLWNNLTQKKSHVKFLLHSLLDSYETNKALAKTLLMKMPPEMLNFDDGDYVKEFLNNSLLLASSKRPPDCISAAYLISLLVSMPNVDIKKGFPDISTSENMKECSAFICLQLALTKLKLELQNAQKSLLLASSSGPMYGLIFVIRHILEGLKFEKIQDDENWKGLIVDIIKTSFECDKAVAFVVNNSSPEGLLPMDFQICDNFEGEEMPNVTSQMVLLCCWRTVKEVSLLLGELAQNVPISSSESPGLVSEQEILSIGDHLTGLLSETKHRGAFEQAYVGFCKLASRLWKYPKGDLHKLPSQWLDETLDEIKNNENLSATRRSAGIPFIIQGLVCTELEVGGGKCFHKGMEVLLNLAQNEENSVETKAHALNILRALFRHSLLGEMVSPYVDRGLAIAINGFKSSSWAERNSSTLLLSALITRIFGVPRSSDTEKLSWKNKMTGRIFFMKYPMLFNILFKHLDCAADSDLYPAIYPVLLILGRLYPSSLEGTDSNLQLEKFIPYVLNCASSPVMKTRSLAASAIVALITPNMFVKFVDKCFEGVFNSKNENFTHGVLLQVLKLVRNIPNECTEIVLTRTNVWILVLIHILESGKHSYIVKETCLKIMYKFVLSFFDVLPNEQFNKFFGILEQNLFCPDRIIDIVEPDFGSSGFLVICTTLLLTLYYKRKNYTTLVDKISYLVQHEEYSVMQTCLTFLIALFEKGEFLYKDLNDMDPLKIECEELEEIAATHLPLAKNLVELLKPETHHEDKLVILKAAKFLPETFSLLGVANKTIINNLTDICLNETETIGALAFDCIGAFLNESLSYTTQEEFNYVCEILKKFNNSDSYECRLSIKNLFENKFSDLITKTKPENAFVILEAQLKLLLDDDAEIRNKNGLNPMASVENFFSHLPDFCDEFYRLCVLFKWALGDFDFEEEFFDDGDRVFDKGDTNSYSEELTLSRFSCQEISKIVSSDESLLEKMIPSYLLEWMRQPFYCDAKSLKEILENAKRSLDDRELGKKSPFRLSETKLLSLEIKLNYLMHAIEGKLTFKNNLCNLMQNMSI